jgi:hypothetical protein
MPRHSDHGVAEGAVASREAEGDWGHVIMPAAATTIRLARRPSRLCYRSASRRVGKRLHVRCKRGEAFGGRRNQWRESPLKTETKIDQICFNLAFFASLDSIQLGSNPKFTLFPPGNATGNFVKIVQRASVKIAIDRGLRRDILLPLGFSVVPTVKVA